MNEQSIRESLEKFNVPHHTRDGIVMYILHGIPPGGFLSAVICNDLMESFARADHVNREAMFEIVSWFYNCAPHNCWKSEENMNAWKGLGHYLESEKETV